MLTPDQIQKTENLCNSEGVYFYDIKIEMIDHVAQGIEEKMQQNPQICFDAALKEIAMEAGVYGFDKIVEEREKEAIKNLHRKAQKLFFEYLTVPKIIGSCLLWLALASPKIFFAASAIINIRVIVICLFLVSTFGLIYSSIKFKKPQEPLLALPSKKWFFGGVVTLQIVNISNILREFKNDLWFNTSWFILLYAAIATLAILFTIAWLNMFKKLYNNMQRKYPLAFQN